MRYLDLAEVKQHLNVDDYYTIDDSYIESLIDVAEEVVASHICRDLKELEVEGQLPSPLLHAMKLLIGTYYENRESIATIDKILPHGYDYLVALYRDYGR